MLIIPAINFIVLLIGIYYIPINDEKAIGFILLASVMCVATEIIDIIKSKIQETINISKFM